MIVLQIVFFDTILWSGIFSVIFAVASFVVFERDVLLKVFVLFFNNLQALKHSLFLNSICKSYFGVKSLDQLKGIDICFIRSQMVRMEPDHFNYYYLGFIFFFHPVVELFFLLSS